MPNPQNPELRRSEESLRPRPELGPDPQDVSGDGGPIPAENQPGHHPEEEQDKPPADKFAEALGIKPDTEVDSEEEARKATRASRRTSKKAAARKAAPARKAAKATSAPAAARSGRGGPRTSSEGGAGGARGTRPATETPISPAPEPAAAAATGTPGAETATASAVASAARRDEPADEAARQHHHELPDSELPHDAGLVTPSGTPLTAKVLHWPLTSWGAVLKASGGLIAAYGNALRKAGERITPGRG